MAKAGSKGVDMAHLEQRRQGFYAVVAVPTALRSIVGRKALRRSLKTRDIGVARQRRHQVVADLLRQIDQAVAASRGLAMNPDMELASALCMDLEAAREADAEADAWAFDEHTPMAANESAVQGEIERQVLARAERSRSRAATFRTVALGQATPLLLHLPAWLAFGGKKGRFDEKTKLSHERELKRLAAWMERTSIPVTVEAVDRKVAGRFVSEDLASADLAAKSQGRIVSACKTYWSYLARKGHVDPDPAKNPWSGQAPSPGEKKGNQESEQRAFTDHELVRLLNGKTDRELADLIRVAALSGMRIEEIYQLRVRDCADNVFNIRQAKTKAGIRLVPVHPDLAEIVARRCAGKTPMGYLFHEPGGAAKEGRGRSMAASKRFGHYRQRVGVHDDAGKRTSLVTFHSFRHWFITTTINAGQRVEVVQQVVGQALDGVTRGVYFHGFDAATRRACVEAVRLPALEADPSPAVPE